MNIRFASVNDTEKLLAIYTPYVLNTAISFEYTPPSADEFAKRISTISEKYPYLVIEHSGDIYGYIYASDFKMRKAYEHCVETSVYIHPNHRKKGYGKLLYNELEKLLLKQNIFNMNACVAYTEAENKYLDNNSFEFHTHMGFNRVGKFTKCGYKFGNWYDIVWFEKLIGSHTQNPECFIPIAKIK